MNVILLSKGILYFAHCILEYNTEVERQALSTLESAFNDEYEILNPRDLSFNNMDNYLKMVRASDAMVFHPFENMYILSGVAKEIRIALIQRMPLFRLHFGKQLIQRLSIDLPLGMNPLTTIRNLDDLSDLTIIEDVEDTRDLISNRIKSGLYAKPSWWK